MTSGYTNGVFYIGTVTNPTATTSAINLNGVQQISGNSGSLATATDYEIANSPRYGQAILMIGPDNDATVPTAIVLLVKPTASTSATITKVVERAGSGAAVFTVTWPTGGNQRINFQHNVGSNKTIYYKLIWG